MNDSERLQRAALKVSKADAFTLRSMVHGWNGMDEVTLINPTGLIRQILAVLDVVAIVHENEIEAAEMDIILKRINS